jgi:hypothetical protein
VDEVENGLLVLVLTVTVWVKYLRIFFMIVILIDFPDIKRSLRKEI